MTIRDFFENYYDGRGKVCVFPNIGGFTVDQGLANSHTLLPGFLKSKLGGALSDFKVTYYQRYVDLEPDDGSEANVVWSIGVRRT